MKSYVLHIENFLRVEKAEIPLSPGVIGLVGNNAQGKTTMIHALSDLIAGKNDFTKIRDGAERAVVKIEVHEDGELQSVVSRTQTKETMKLDAKGLRPGQTAIGFLGTMLDEIAVNPVTLATSNPVEYLKQHLQVEIEKADIPEPMQEAINTLRLFDGKEVNVKETGFALCERLAADVEASRRATGKQMDQERAVVADLKKTLPMEQPPMPFNEDDVKKDITALQARVANAAEANANHRNAAGAMNAIEQKIRQAAQGIENIQKERRSLLDQVAKMDIQIELLTGQMAELNSVEITKAQQKLKENPAVDLAGVEDEIKKQTDKLQQIAVVKRIQQGFKVLFQREAGLKALEDAYKKQDTVTKFFRYELPKRLIAKCKLPVEGIEFKDGHMFVNGHAIERLSTAEKAIVTTKLAIAIAKQKGHIAVCLDGVESLDEEHRKEFLKAAQDSGMCILYTRFGAPEYPHEKEVKEGKIIQ